MDKQALFNVLVGLAGAFGGWVLNSISRSIQRLDDDVRKMPLIYVTQTTYQRDIDEVKAMLSKIFDKLDSKQDKP